MVWIAFFFTRLASYDDPRSFVSPAEVWHSLVSYRTLAHLRRLEFGAGESRCAFLNTSDLHISIPGSYPLQQTHFGPSS